MTTIKIANYTIEVDEDGYLKDIKQWNKYIAESMAKKDSINLTSEHWIIMNFLVEYYNKYEVSPPVRILVRSMSKQFGAEFGNSRKLYELFPLGPVKQGSLYAGLPKPTNCI